MSDPIIASVLAGTGFNTDGTTDVAAKANTDNSGSVPTASAAVGLTSAPTSDASTGRDDEDDGPGLGIETEPDDDENADDSVGPDKDDELEDREAPDPAKAIIESFPENDDEEDADVVEVAEPASCLALPTKARTDREDRRLVELRGKGFSDEQLRAVGAVLTTASRRQRKLPVHAAVCSAVMQAYWAGRDRERREADCMKAIRNDGGQLGPVRYYESIIRKHDPLAAAKLLAEHHAERITAIRYIVTATFNEGRREDAVAKGVDPTTVKYLQVRAK